MIDKFLKLDKDSQNIHSIVISFLVLVIGIVGMFIGFYSDLINNKVNALQLLDDITAICLIISVILLIGYKASSEMLFRYKKQQEELNK